MKTLVMACAAVVLMAADAGAQIRGFADAGWTMFSANESFEAVLGTRFGPVFGGGVQLDVPRGLFLSLRASRFHRHGERVFIFEGERFGLGIKTKVTILPVELSGGYRFNRSGRFIPYGAGGVSWHRYKETQGASDAEDVDEQFIGFQLLGGGEFPIGRLLAIAGEAEWATVPDALGNNASSVATAFDEHDLGGFTVRFKVVIGR